MLIAPPVYCLLVVLVLVLAAISVNGTAERPNPLLPAKGSVDDKGGKTNDSLEVLRLRLKHLCG